MRPLGANVGATLTNGFLRHANEYGQTDGDHASSQTGRPSARSD
jgi:hypothetical protein